MDKHDVSRTPWTYEVHELSTGLSAVVYDENGQAIDMHLTEEKAARITRAVNSHDDLVSALELCVSRLKSAIAEIDTLRDESLDWEPNTQDDAADEADSRALEQAHAAIKRAKGEQP